ncbi:MAG: hypothetical protein GQ562_05955, partial [Anaerolineales bacterium]|nr:hypothetical protein [Anaerolineales bacterium]
METHKYTFIQTRIIRYLALVIVLVLVLIASGCDLFDFQMPESPLFGPAREDEKGDSIVPNPGEGGSSGPGQVQGYLGDETAEGAPAADGSPSSGGEGDLKPVGFVNYGEFDATVRAWTYFHLGETES